MQNLIHTWHYMWQGATLYPKGYNAAEKADVRDGVMFFGAVFAARFLFIKMQGKKAYK